MTENITDDDMLTDRVLMCMILVEVRELREKHDEILTVVAGIKEQVEPMVERLQNSPVFKMLGGA